MDSQQPVIALLSIKPRYANAILNGSKKVEFRKRRFGQAVSHVVIYATTPVQKVIGWFKTGTFHELSPAGLWRRFARVGGIARKEFRAYYRNSESGVAIGVKRPIRLTNAIPLGQITSSPPPQSYSYLPVSVLSILFPLAVKPATPKRYAARKKTGINKSKRRR